MFKCKECGQEYKTKPDYCDCGNDTFDELILDKVLQDDVVNVSPCIATSEMDFVSFLRRRNISVFGLTFFVSCLFLSFFILVFCFNFKSEISNTSAQKTEKNVINIPDIEQLWNDGPIDVAQSITVKKSQNVRPSQIANNNTQAGKTTTNKIIAPTRKSNTKSESTVVNTSKKLKSQTSNKPLVKTSQATSVKKPDSKSSVSTKNVKQDTTHKKEQVNVPLSPKKTIPAYSPELNNYKVALRNALFSKLSVVSIQGQGTCGIEFSIDSTGKLINRAFTYQSNNKSVNDEVYKMLMRLPSFYAPPETYNGEKIKMSFSFDNGSYVINYTN